MRERFAQKIRRFVGQTNLHCVALEYKDIILSECRTRVDWRGTRTLSGCVACNINKITAEWTASIGCCNWRRMIEMMRYDQCTIKRCVGYTNDCRFSARGWAEWLQCTRWRTSQVRSLLQQRNAINLLRTRIYTGRGLMGLGMDKMLVHCPLITTLT